MKKAIMILAMVVMVSMATVPVVIAGGRTITAEFYDIQDNLIGVETPLDDEKIDNKTNFKFIPIPEGADRAKINFGSRLPFTLNIGTEEQLTFGGEMGSPKIVVLHNLKMKLIAIDVVSEGIWETMGEYGKVTVKFNRPDPSDRIELIRTVTQKDIKETMFFEIPKGSHGDIWIEEFIIPGGFLITDNYELNWIRGGEVSKGSHSVPGRDIEVTYSDGIMSIHIISKLPEKPKFADWSHKEAKIMQQFIEYYAAGGGLAEDELHKVATFVLGNSNDNESRAWAWTMLVEYTSCRFSGAEEFARWGLLLTRPFVTTETWEAITTRLIPYDGPSADMWGLM